MGLSKVTVYDKDHVEGHNQPGQVYREGDIGESKVNRLASYCHIIPRPYYINDYTILGQELVVSAVDSNGSRRAIWNAALRGDCEWFFDGRLGGQMCMLYTIKMDDVESMARYEESLHDDADRHVVPCAESAVIDVAFTMAAMIARAVRLALTSGEHAFRRINCQRTGSTMEVK